MFDNLVTTLLRKSPADQDDGLPASASASTRVLSGAASSRPSLGGIAAGRPPAYEMNVTILVDRSSSMPAEALRYVFGPGLASVLSTLERAGRKNGYRYNVRVAAFSTRCEEVVPFCGLDEARRALRRCSIGPRGVTCLEGALRDAFDATDALKSRQDACGIPRVGSLVIIVTDGRPTDEEGALASLSDAMAAEIVRRNETRKTTTFAIGFGRVQDDVLRALGPATRSFVDGEYREMPRAIRYRDETYEDTACWQAVCDIMGTASSSRGGTPVLVYRDDDAFPGDDVVEIDETRYAIVR